MPAPHILQSWEWGEAKHATTGWRPHRYAFYRGGELLAIATFGIRRIGPFRLMYAPRGPLFAADDVDYRALLTEMEKLARDERVIWLKIDPGISLAEKPIGATDWQQAQQGQQLRTALMDAGWRYSAEQIQFPNTQVLSLEPSEATLLANMGASARRKIRLAERRGVRIRQGAENDLDLLYDLYAETAARDGFGIRPAAYYRHVWRALMAAGRAKALIAEYQDGAIAHSILLHGGATCWFFYGASSSRERARMPNYALQWAGIRWAKNIGYHHYDFWGAPTEFAEDDPLWGVYQFKRGFRGRLVRGLGAWDFTPSPTRYALYQRIQRYRK